MKFKEDSIIYFGVTNQVFNDLGNSVTNDLMNMTKPVRYLYESSEILYSHHLSSNCLDQL